MRDIEEIRNYFRYTDWPSWRREHWPKVCLVVGAMILSWALTGWGPVSPGGIRRAFRINTAPQMGFSLNERLMATAASGLIATWLATRRRKK